MAEFLVRREALPTRAADPIRARTDFSVSPEPESPEACSGNATAEGDASLTDAALGAESFRIAPVRRMTS